MKFKNISTGQIYLLKKDKALIMLENGGSMYYHKNESFKVVSTKRNKNDPNETSKVITIERLNKKHELTHKVFKKLFQYTKVVRM